MRIHADPNPDPQPWTIAKVYLEIVLKTTLNSISIHFLFHTTVLQYILHTVLNSPGQHKKNHFIYLLFYFLLDPDPEL